jgi:hypothetical protein
MWILSWLVNFTPDFVYHLMVFVGLIGLLFSFFLNIFPFVSANKLAIQLISIVLLIVGVWFEGFNSNNKVWEAKVKELNAQIVVAEQKAADANSKIEYVYIDRIKIVKDTQVLTNSTIQKEANVIDKQCSVVSDAIDIMNSSATNPVSKK